MNTLKTIYLTTLHLSLLVTVGIIYGYLTGQLGGAPLADTAPVPEYIADTGFSR